MECYICKKENPHAFILNELICCEVCKECPEIFISFFDNQINTEIIFQNGIYATFQKETNGFEEGYHYTEYYKKNGVQIILLTYNYNADKTLKSVIKYYMDGHNKEIKIYEHGNLRQLRQYYDNGYGTPSLKIEYNDNKYHGEYILWNRMHQILKSYNYKDGILHGECYESDINGNIQYIKVYDNGNIVSHINYIS